ncbi:MAG: PAS domain S-box protein, partial [Chloroflexota bacterium]
LTYIDISETARLAVQLQRSRARLAAMVESNPNGMLVADDSGDILMVNPSLERMFGYGVDDLLGAPVELLLPEGSRVRHVALRGGYERQPTARPMGAGRELSGRRRDGTLFPIEVSLSAFQDGGRTLMQAMVVDISERRAAEAAIAASQATNARLASIVASSDDAIVGADPDGQITTWTPGAERLLGRSADQAIGLSLASLFVDPAEAARARSGPSPGAETVRHDTSLRHGDGSLVDASVVLSTIRDPRGQAIGLSLIAHDARERVRAAARREQLQRELEDQVAQRTQELQALNERLAEALARAESATRAKSSFLANMSHEIRTPLNAIIGTSYLVKQANATPEQQEQLTRIERAASHLVEIISNILDLSKIETGKVSLETIELSIDTISRDVATMCESAARARDLEIRVDLAPMPWRLRGDVTRLRQAWLNYAANAVKFTDAGDITLRTRVVEERADRVCIRFEVEDTGIGVDREAIERLFAAFEQADSSTTRRYGGTGLGLAITRGLAELMDGAVGVDANPSVGSRRPRPHPVASIPANATASLSPRPGSRDGTQCTRNAVPCHAPGHGLVEGRPPPPDVERPLPQRPCRLPTPV